MSQRILKLCVASLLNILCFPGSKEYFDSVALAHHPMQYLGELVFFHTPLYIRGVWKNINSPKYYIGWCARATEQSFNFFRKSGKIQKNSKNSKKIKNEASAMYCLIYIFFR